MRQDISIDDEITNNKIDKQLNSRVELVKK